MIWGGAGLLVGQLTAWTVHRITSWRPVGLPLVSAGLWAAAAGFGGGAPALLLTWWCACLMCTDIASRRLPNQLTAAGAVGVSARARVEGQRRRGGRDGLERRVELLLEAAADAFEQLTRLQPDSRDAWFNYANALFAAESWELLAPVGDRLTEVDPLGENAGLIAARAHMEMGDNQAAVEGLDRTESAPIHVEGLQLRPSEVETSLQGRVVGNPAEPGTSVHLRFTFYGAEGALGTEPLIVSAPPRGVPTRFAISFAGQATAYRYELLSPPIP